MRWILLFLMAFSAPLFAEESEEQKVEVFISTLRATRDQAFQVKSDSEGWKPFTMNFQQERVTLSFPGTPMVSREIGIWVYYEDEENEVDYEFVSFDPSWKIHDVQYFFDKVIEGITADDYFDVSYAITKDAQGYDRLEYTETSDYYEYRTTVIVTPYNVYVLQADYGTGEENGYGYFVESCSIVKK